MTNETMTSKEVQARLRYKNRTDATKWLHVRGIRPVSRNLDQSVNYPAAEVEAALARRPGKGSRTDTWPQCAACGSPVAPADRAEDDDGNTVHAEQCP